MTDFLSLTVRVSARDTLPDHLEDYIGDYTVRVSASYSPEEARQAALESFTETLSVPCPDLFSITVL